jgi:hypothetical protein
MNKTRIFGISLFIIGVIAQLSIENDLVDFISGILIGLGIGIIISGRLKK